METIYLIQPAELVGSNIYKLCFSLSEDVKMVIKKEQNIYVL